MDSKDYIKIIKEAGKLLQDRRDQELRCAAPLINIIEKQHEVASLSVRAVIPEDLWCFPDHFPNQPIVPGYLQLIWLSEILKEFFPEASNPRTIDKIKYHAPLQPGQEFLLQANWTCATRSLSFTITSCDRKISSGRYCY